MNLIKIGGLLLGGLLFGGSSVVLGQNSVITIGNDAGGVGDSVTVPITFVENNDDIANWDLDIAYQTSDLTLRGGSGNPGDCGFVDFGPAVAGANVTCLDLGSGVLRVLIDPVPVGLTIPALPEGELAAVRFTVAAGPNLGANSPVTFDSIAAADNVPPSGNTVPASNYTANPGFVNLQAGEPELSFNFNASEVTPPGPLDIGSTQLIAATAPSTLQVCNSGAVGSVIDDITAQITSNTDDFSVVTTNCDSASLVGAATPDCCDLDITFGPGDAPANGRVGEITVGASVGGTPTSTAFNLTGTYTAGPAANLTIDLTSFDFGGVNVGDSPTATFTIENEGPANSEAEITANPSAAGGEFSVTGGDCSDGTTLASGVSCQVIVEFAPTSAGPQTGTLTVSGRDSLNNVTLSPPLTADLEGVGNGSIFNVTPGLTNNLGTTTPGETLGPLDVLISNTGNEALTLTCDPVEGDVDQFTFVPEPALTPAPVSVAADGTLGFTVSCSVPEQATYSVTQACRTNEPTPQSVTFSFSCSARPLVVSTMQNWGLILMALMMMLVGGFSIRFFRT